MSVSWMAIDTISSKHPVFLDVAILSHPTKSNHASPLSLVIPELVHITLIPVM